MDRVGQWRAGAARPSARRRHAGSPATVADVMLTYVEEGIDAVLDVGGLDEAYASSMESMYRRALTHVGKHDLQPDFRERCEKLLLRSDELGWGLGDALTDIHYELFSDDPPDA